MKIKTVTSLVAVLSVLSATLAIYGRAAAARPNGDMPIQVSFSGGGVKSQDGQQTMTVTMSENEVDDESVPVSYTNLVGPATVTIPAGSDSGSATVTVAAEYGDTASATASNENGQATGSFTIQ